MRQRTGHVMLGVLIGIALSQTMVAGAHTESALHSKLKSLTNTLKNVSSRVSSLEGSMALVKSDLSSVKSSVELVKITEIGPLKSKTAKLDPFGNYTGTIPFSRVTGTITFDNIWGDLSPTRIDTPLSCAGYPAKWSSAYFGLTC